MRITSDPRDHAVSCGARPPITWRTAALKGYPIGFRSSSHGLWVLLLCDLGSSAGVLQGVQESAACDLGTFFYDFGCSAFDFESSAYGFGALR